MNTGVTGEPPAFGVESAGGASVVPVIGIDGVASFGRAGGCIRVEAVVVSGAGGLGAVWHPASESATAEANTAARGPAERIEVTRVGSTREAQRSVRVAHEEGRTLSESHSQ